jgi:hypothetical protein
VLDESVSVAAGIRVSPSDISVLVNAVGVGGNGPEGARVTGSAPSLAKLSMKDLRVVPGQNIFE